MKVLIVEDEKAAAEKLLQILLEIDSSIEVVGNCDSVLSTTNWLKSNPIPELIFSDIQLTDGISFEIFKNVEINCPIIFVTAFDEFAIKSFEVNSVDYILKPYSINEIRKGISKHKKYFPKSSPQNNTDLYVELSKALAPSYKTRFFTKLNNNVYSIKTQDLLHIKYEDKASILMDVNNRSFYIAYSLDTLEGLLNPSKFFRINRQFIISFKSIIKMDISAKGRIGVRLVNQTEKEYVSRSKTKEFKAWLDQ